jgi:hypothetical protein
MQQAQQTGAATAGEQDARDLHQALQQRSTALVPHGQPVDLLSEGHLLAQRILAIQTTHLQLDTSRPATDRGICQTPRVSAVDPIAPAAATGAGSRLLHAGAGVDDDNRTRRVDRGDHDRGQMVQ